MDTRILLIVVLRLFAISELIWDLLLIIGLIKVTVEAGGAVTHVIHKFALALKTVAAAIVLYMGLYQEEYLIRVINFIF